MEWTPIITALLTILAAFINTVVVLAVIQVAKIKIPIIREKVPWLLPILAGSIGAPLLAAQNYLTTLIGLPVDLSPIIGIFTGATAVAVNQVGKQVTKIAAMILLCIFLAMSMTSCTMIQRTLGISPQLEKQWQAATEEERVRLVIKDIQSSLDDSLDIGTLYVATHPEKKADWKALVLPLFKKANDVIGDVIRDAKTTQGKVTLAGALLKIQPHLMEIEKILLEWNIKK
jgi:hypothetical protein